MPQDGMALERPNCELPFLMISNRNRSLTSRIASALVKSRIGWRTTCAPGPSPLPRGPWQTAQWFSKRVRPGLSDVRARRGSSPRRSARPRSARLTTKPTKATTMYVRTVSRMDFAAVRTVGRRDADATIRAGNRARGAAPSRTRREGRGTLDGLRAVGGARGAGEEQRGQARGVGAPTRSYPKVRRYCSPSADLRKLVR